ncbi:RRM domain-containing protein [Verticillium alfalfae VaMs.102]|uniref:RRM domain-containing protein n=1 Tax=Verticillium alfalfae (strain VaMs.102 / ATCC MYA-4576 / FGSC 10136) TaxID=526221 RepID=C9SC37_VERA1|nr:RRM domain-containing protein [Verticillium alfalfae VaMs.102]EEY15921.1 RRM domain-containing protein [Verticillium alfalfae VaMs.102]
MADDEFEIDIYGDAPQENQEGHHEYEGGQQQQQEHDHREDHDDGGQHEHKEEPEQYNDQSSSAPQQGTKRKGDDRVVDPGATNAITISDLNWWNTDDEIRGWSRRAHCEDELKDITFSEHKVNGKSKGQVYIEFASQQAATATKHLVDKLEGNTPGQKRYNVAYSNPNVNPFRTLPKDTSNRQPKEGQGSRATGTFNNDNSANMGGNFRGNYRGRGGGGGFVPRGGMNQNNYNRNFAGGMGGYNQNNNMGGFNNGGMGGVGFNNNNMGGFNRGGFGGGMRGGPVYARWPRWHESDGRYAHGPNGRNANGRNGQPHGHDGWRHAGGSGVKTRPMMKALRACYRCFQGMPQQFNPGFFGQGGGGQGGGDWGNPHGAKRPRPE